MRDRLAIIGWLLAATFLSACTVSNGARPQTTTSAANTASARLAALDWPPIANRNPRFIVFGELHGTEQSPAFFGSFAEALAADGKRLLIAVELSAEQNDVLQVAWHGPHRDFAETVTVGEWRDRQDGVTSAAMLDMLAGLHAAKAAGAAISVVAFNGPRNIEQQQRLYAGNGQAGHEIAQAENILLAADSGAYDYVLVLVGSVHASRSEAIYPNDRFQPMAVHLAQYGPLVSLNMQTAGGSSWSCQLATGTQLTPGQEITDDMIDCGGHPIRASSIMTGAPRMVLDPNMAGGNERSYDGVYWLGRVTASPPARRGVATPPAQ